MNGHIAEKQRRHDLFVQVYATSGDATAAALAAGYAKRSAKQQASRLMTGADLGTRAREARDTWVKAQGDAHARQAKALIEKADVAIEALADIAKGVWHEDVSKKIGAQARVLAAIAILDRAGHKPVERVESTVKWEDVTRELADVEAAAVLRTALADIAASEVAQPSNAG